MMTLNGSADTGFGYGIGVSKLGKVILPNFVKKVSEIEANEIRKEIPKFDENHILVNYKEEYFVYGNLCVEMYPSIDRRIASKDRIGGIYHEVELLCTLAFIAPDNNDFAINLGVGLPLKLRDKKEEVVKWLKSEPFEITFLTKDTEINKTITVANLEVLEQPLAPLYVLPKESRKGMMISIDIGHGTTDAVLINNGLILTEIGSNFNATGMDKVYKQLRFLLLHKFNKDPYNITSFSDLEIQKILESQKFFISNDKMEDVEQDISKELNISLDDYIEYTHDKIENYFADYIPKSKAFMASGGILNNSYFKDKLSGIFKTNYSKPLYMTNRPQWNVALGLYNYINDKYTDDFNKQNVELLDKTSQPNNVNSNNQKVLDEAAITNNTSTEKEV